MPRYFFNIHDGLDVQDADGLELADLKAAQTEAVKLFGALLIDQPARLWGGEDCSLEVTDADGSTLFALRCHALPCAAMRCWPPR